MLKKEQVKKLSDTLTVLAYAQFGVFGYNAWQAGDILGTFVSGFVFVWLQSAAIWALSYPKEKDHA